MKITSAQLLALKRKKGELGLTWDTISKETGVSRRTLYSIVNGSTNVHSLTFNRINDWIIDQYTS